MNTNFILFYGDVSSQLAIGSLQYRCDRHLTKTQPGLCAHLPLLPRWYKSSQVSTLPKAKSETRSKQNKGMRKCSSV